jgi:transposase
MLTQEDDVDAHALRKRGWSISAIARHLGHNRKTIRLYLNGERTAGVRVRADVSPFDPFVDYCRERLVEDPHLWAMTLFDEIVALGFVQSYPTFPRQIRLRSLRPNCERCSAAKGERLVGSGRCCLCCDGLLPIERWSSLPTPRLEC